MPVGPRGTWEARSGPLHVRWRPAWRRRRRTWHPCRSAGALGAQAHTGPASGGLVPAQGRLQLLLLLGQLHLELSDLRLQFCDLLMQVTGLPIQLPLELLKLLPALLLLLQPHCEKARMLQRVDTTRETPGGRTFLLRHFTHTHTHTHTHTEEPSHGLVEGKSTLVTSTF